MIALIFAIGWFFTACAFTWQSWKTSQMQEKVWALEDQLWHVQFKNSCNEDKRKLYR